MIDILLPTYNSEKFLAEQISSIIEQDYDKWTLLIHDGGSTDKTMDIIDEFCLAHPDKIKFLPSSGRYTAVENFSLLLEASTAPYIMFADHDDVWVQDKVGKSFEKMLESETRFGKDTPILVFTDKHVVDDNLNELATSYFEYQKIDPTRIALKNLLIQNISSGCAMVINRPLVELSLPFANGIIMHDHWLALIAAAFGKIVFLNDASVLYRQHSNNIFGASKYGMGYAFRKLRMGKKGLRKIFYRNVEQAAAFLETFYSRIPPEQIEMLQDFVSLKNLSGIRACNKLIKHRIFKSGIMRNIGMFYILF